MKKKFKQIAILGCLSIACAAFAACGEKTIEEEYQDKGYKISVTYDPNGGKFMGHPGVSVTDMFKPDNYEKDDEGAVHIKLLEPTDSSRPTSGHDGISLTMPNHFFAGWYQTRTVKTNDKKQPVDKNGRVLKQLEDGTYVYADEKKEVVATPAYIYSDFWDFETDTVDYKESDYKKTDGVLEITLYAGWVEYYEFNYYAQNAKGEWEMLPEKTSFDYKTTNEEGSKTADKDTIWLPDWKDGAMNYTYTYANNSIFSFPKVADTTFSKAYLDQACTQEITTESFEHQGTLDYETCTPINRIQNIYLKLDKGEQYRITTAAQLAAASNPNGYYEIQADLDFTGAQWPAALSYGTFTGKMYGMNGNSYTISNVSVKYNSSAQYGGAIFGKIAKDAEVKNITFQDVTLDLSFAGQRQQNRQYGLFSGEIDEGAKVSNVSINGSFKIGAIILGNGFEINLLANGKTDGITQGHISLEVYGNNRNGRYWYTFDPTAVTVSDSGQVSLTFSASEKEYEKEKYIIIEEKMEVNQYE